MLEFFVPTRKPDGEAKRRWVEGEARYGLQVTVNFVSEFVSGEVNFLPCRWVHLNRQLLSDRVHYLRVARAMLVCSSVAESTTTYLFEAGLTVTEYFCTAPPTFAPPRPSAPLRSSSIHP